MTTWRWIISHRRCWITFYVFCRNAHMNIIVIIMSYICIVVRSIFCQLPSCNLFTQHVSYLLRTDTTSELWIPVHSFTLIKPPTANNCSLLLPAIKYYFPHHTFNPLLQQAGKIDNLPVSLGQSSLIVLCADSTLAPDSLVLRRAIFRHQQPSEVISCSYWSIKPWFHTEGNCCYTASYLPLGVSQRTCVSRHQLVVRIILFS